MEKILVALSGGIDSSVAALLLKLKGYSVSGVYMRTWIKEEEEGSLDCPWRVDMNNARQTALHLDLSFKVINFTKEYKKQVADYFIESYSNGLTPNPDIICNRKIKFGLLRKYAIKNGFQGLATGHYCRKKLNLNGKLDALSGVDKEKDQSYFISLIKQNQLGKIYFPVGNLKKNDVRLIAMKYQLPNCSRKDSQGICFLSGNFKVSNFLSKYIPDCPGSVINSNGNTIGRHLGLHRYTIGQRRGIGIPSNRDFEHFVVVSKDIKHNNLYIAFDHETSSELYRKQFIIYDINYINRVIHSSRYLNAKPRYRNSMKKVFFEPIGLSSAKVTFQTKQRALTAGQILALYDNDRLIGGGIYI